MPFALSVTMRMDAKYKVPMHQPDFIRLCLELGVLRFGDFRLKSGRQSPYFFHAGLFNTGRAIAALGRHYARAAALSGLAFDMLFRTAYKGIPPVTAPAAPPAAAPAAALALHESRDRPFAFNRKEAKDHGEGGTLIGAPLAGRVLIVDDVITAGTAIRESVELIRRHGATATGVLIALDREERGQGERSAVQEVQEMLGLPVVAVLRRRAPLRHTAGHRAED